MMKYYKIWTINGYADYVHHRTPIKYITNMSNICIYREFSDGSIESCESGHNITTYATHDNTCKYTFIRKITKEEVFVEIL